MLKETWAIAIETLSWMEIRRLNERSALVRTISQLKINNPQVIRYAYNLIVETTRRKNFIDKIINATLSPKKIGEYNQGIQAFLRLYVYKTRLAKNYGKFTLKEADSISSLGRSILSWQMMREIEPYLGFLLTLQIEPIIMKSSETERVALETFHPEWFVDYCTKLFGIQEAKEFLKASLNPPPTYIRINTLAAAEEEILIKLAEEGIELEKVKHIKYTYKVLKFKEPLNSSLSLKKGFFYVQDKASCFAAQVAEAKPNNTVFDVCASPGAKTTIVAQLMENQGSIVSLDFSPKRMRTWIKEIKRMGTKIADPLVADARVSIPITNKANVVMLDPPCTSTGVFAKQPSAKWRLSPKSMENMSKIQLQMLNNCAYKVAEGGILVYSTCSVTEEENELVIERFLKEHPDFMLAEIDPQIGLPGLRGLTQCQRLYPHIHQCNGFFIAKLQKHSTL